MLQKSHFWIYISKGDEISILKSYLQSHVLAVLFTIAKTWKQPQCPSIDEWTKKMWCKYNRVWH